MDIETQKRLRSIIDSECQRIMRDHTQSNDSVYEAIDDLLSTVANLVNASRIDFGLTDGYLPQLEVTYDA